MLLHVSYYQCYYLSINVTILLSMLLSYYQCYYLTIDVTILVSMLLSYYRCYYLTINVTILLAMLLSYYQCYHLNINVTSTSTSYYQILLSMLQVPLLCFLVQFEAAAIEQFFSELVAVC